MNNLLLILLVVSSCGYSIDSPRLDLNRHTNFPTIIRVYYKNQQHVQKLSEITALWEVNTNQNYVLMMVNDYDELSKVQLLDLPVHIDSKRQKKYFSKQRQSIKSITGSQTIPGFSCYSTVEGTFTRMAAMETNFPNLAEIIDIGDSWEKTIDVNNGYDLKVMKITNQNNVTDKPVLFMTSAIHAREYTTAELTTRFAEMLLDQYETNADVRWMLDHQEVHLLLHTNPDGRKKAEAGLLWRKNTNTAYCTPTSNDRGADLNRNYPFFWESNNNQCAATFPGSTVQSEPEVDFVMSYLNTIYDDNRGPGLNDSAPLDTAGVFLDIHSFSQLILWPWGFTSAQPPNADQFKAFGKRVALFNNYKPEPVSDLTIAKGGSIDASYGELGVASLAFELGTDFFQDCNTFENNILPDNLKALLYISRISRTPYSAPLGPDIEDLLLIPNVITSGQSVSISGRANDDRYNHSNGSQVVEQVDSVDMYINDLPWLHTNSQSVNAEDGNYDSSQESFKHVIDTDSLSTGKNQVFVVATDSNDKEGGVFARFLNVVDPVNVGTISGVVTNAVSGNPISGSQLVVEESMGLSDNFGNYSLLVFPSTSELLISADGFVSKTITNVEIIQQQTSTLDIELEPFCSTFSDDMESGIQLWLADSPWAIVDNSSVSPTHSWTDSPNVNYADNIDIKLTSATIDVSGASNMEISFNSFCDTESGFDFGHLEVSFDGSNWDEVFRCDGESTWKHIAQSVDIPSNSQLMKLRFRLSSDASVTRPGWGIDDVNVKVSGQPCHLLSEDIIYINGFE